MFIPITPLQMASLAGMAHQRNKIAIEELETLKRIEEQNRETLKRIEEQNRQIEAANGKPNVTSLLKQTKPSYQIGRIPSSAKYTTCPKCQTQTNISVGKCQFCGFNRWTQRL